MERRCFIHAGTHKTGTTSLQDMLVRNERTFAGANVLIARTGRPVALARSAYVGNQNLAWQMVGDPRYDPATGTLDDLQAELSASRLATAVVTSEDFVLAFDRPERLAALREAVCEAGYRPSIVIYLRDQASYARSLYAMFAVTGMLPLTFDEFAEIVLRDALIGWGSNRFPFEYERIVEPFVACFGASDVVVRPYRYERTNARLVHHFFDDLGVSVALDRLGLIESARTNEGSSTFDVMSALHRNLSVERAGLPAPSEIAMTLNVARDALDGVFAPVDSALAAEFRTRFSASNAALRSRFDVALEQRARDSTSKAEAAAAFARACSRAWRAAVRTS